MLAASLLCTLVRSISTSYHISYVRQLTTTTSSITTLFQFMSQFIAQFILSSFRKRLSSIAHCHHFHVKYKRLLSSFWFVHTYVSWVSTYTRYQNKAEKVKLMEFVHSLAFQRLAAFMSAKSLHVMKYVLIHLSSSILFCRKCVKRFLFLSVATETTLNIGIVGTSIG